MSNNFTRSIQKLFDDALPYRPPSPRSQLHNCSCDVHVLRSHKLLHEFEILQYLEKKKQTEVRRNQPVVDCSDFSACTAWAS
jgi:hypothetical protein